MKSTSAKENPIKKGSTPNTESSTLWTFWFKLYGYLGMSRHFGTENCRQFEAKDEYISETEIRGLQKMKAVVDNAPLKFAEFKRWPLVIDPSDTAVTYMMHTDCVILTPLQGDDLQPETIRQDLLEALRYSKTFILNMMDFKDSTLFTTTTEAFDRVHPGLMDMCLTNIIQKEENIEKLSRAEDRDDATNERLDGFKFVVMTTNVSPPKDLFHKFITYKIVW